MLYYNRFHILISKLYIIFFESDINILTKKQFTIHFIMMHTGMSVTIVIHIYTVNVYKLVYMIHCSIGHIHCIVSPFKEKIFTAFKHSYGNQIVPGKKNI